MRPLEEYRSALAQVADAALVSRRRAAPVVCCDLDGVIWRGDDADPGVGAEAVDELRAAGPAGGVPVEQLEPARRRT